MVKSGAQYVTDVNDVRYCSLDVPSPQHPQNVDRESEAAIPSRKCQCIGTCYFLCIEQRKIIKPNQAMHRNSINLP